MIPALFAVSPEAIRLPLAMLLVFGSAKLLDELFERIGQPGIVGEILAGVVIGPSVLGWVHPGGLLEALAELGVMFLLFRVGLEVKASELFRVGGTALVVAVLGVIAPFLMGWGILLWWGEPHIEAIFTGAAMVATSVGITAQVLSSRGLIGAKASKIILAAAVIDDVLGLLVLAMVSNLARGEINIAGLCVTAVVATAFTLIVARWGTRAMNRVVPRVKARLRVEEAQFTLAMCLLFALSLAAVYAGVAAIVGAFLAGVALSESVGRRVHDLTAGVAELLVPFFLAGVGLHLDLRVFASAPLVVLAGVVLLAAVVSKLAACGLGALSLGRAEALRVGVGMIPRGEVGLVVAQLGQRMGIVSGPVYGVVVFMAVATTLVAPPLIALAFRGLPCETGPEKTEAFRLG
jgi:Kef-type K+ transport system membrane component KefB